MTDIEKCRNWMIRETQCHTFSPVCFAVPGHGRDFLSNAAALAKLLSGVSMAAH